jgi:uridine phosphorylase
VVVASGGSGYISRNPDAFASCYEGGATEGTTTSTTSEADETSYRLAKIAPADSELSNLVLERLTEQLGAENLRSGVNVTAESFYSSQGRIDPDFEDNNHNINSLLLSHYPAARSLEMESFWLLHLAKCCKVPIKATAAAIVLANRPTGHVMDGKHLDNAERKGGLAMLQALTQITL